MCRHNLVINQLQLIVMQVVLPNMKDCKLGGESNHHIVPKTLKRVAKLQQLPSGLDAEEPHDIELPEDVELALPGEIELPGDEEQPELPGEVELPVNVELPGEVELPGDEEQPELPGEVELPGNVELPGEVELPDNVELPGDVPMTEGDVELPTNISTELLELAVVKEKLFYTENLLHNSKDELRKASEKITMLEECLKLLR